MTKLLEEHLSHPNEIADHCGKLVGENASLALDHFCSSFGQTLMSKQQVCDRIDFLYDHSGDPKNEDVHMYVETVHSGNQIGVQWLSDACGDFRNLSAVFLRGLENDDVYAIRLFVRNNDDVEPDLLRNEWSGDQPTFARIVGETVDEEHLDPFRGGTVKVSYDYATDNDGIFWNFKRIDDRVKIFEPSKAFLYPYATRAVINMLTWATNVLGFPVSLN